jgi:gas vesicle protein
MTDEGKSMHSTKGCYSGLAVSLAFLGGAVAGALAGILLTTKSGQEVRWDLEDYAREKQQYLLRKAEKVRAELGDAIQRGKTFISKQVPRAKNDANDEKPDVGTWRPA